MTETAPENKEIVVVPGQSLAEVTDDIIASAERRIANIEKIIGLALRITNEHDWVDQQGKPYLTASGAEKIARLFGVCWSNIKTEKILTEDEKGKFYFYQTSGIFSLRNDKVEAVGTCSSKDQFFAKRGGQLLPLSDVDETNIMKASYSNCTVNGITRLLGLRNLTWEQVESSGLKRGKVAAVAYAQGGAGGGKISEAQGKRLYAILTAGSKDQNEKDFRASELKKYIRENYKIEHSKDIERKDYEDICKKAEDIAKRTVNKGAVPA
jgi:hypothetical protein